MCNIKFESKQGQDKWVIDILKYKKFGYFVDTGASDGIRNSNSYALEKHFDWTGICVEPNPNLRAFPTLIKNRNCICESVCVHSENTTVDFLARGRHIETSGIYGDFSSTYIKYQHNDKSHPTIKLNAITLLQLLQKHKSPNVIDYISIDTEGSEWEILRVFDFNQYIFKTMTIENNFNGDDNNNEEKLHRDNIRNLLYARGYVLKNSLHFGEDWFVHNSIEYRDVV